MQCPTRRRGSQRNREAGTYRHRLDAPSFDRDGGSRRRRRFRPAVRRLFLHGKKSGSALRIAREGGREEEDEEGERGRCYCVSRDGRLPQRTGPIGWWGGSTVGCGAGDQLFFFFLLFSFNFQKPYLPFHMCAYIYIFIYVFRLSKVRLS